MDITFIGGGNMATALAGGLAAKGFAARAMKIVEVLPDARKRLADSLGVATFDAPASAAPYGDVVVLAVKPQQMREAARAVAPHLKAELVLSIAAGIRLVDLGRWLGGYARLARCMPNTPALIGLGVTGLYARPEVAPAQRAHAQAVLEAVGEVIWVDDEALLDPVTAVSGSGPAYFFLLMEELEKVAVELGLDAESARLLTIQTALGAARMAMESSLDPRELRERVTSPGGTTECAIKVLMEGDFSNLIARAVRAAQARSQELSTLLATNP
jgi:pyrroline-5-carboxylate reductase